jgi:hypothetical protein
VTIDPKAAVAQDNLLGAQLAMDKVADAESTLANMKEAGIDMGRTFSLREVLMLDFLRGDSAGMQQTVKATQGRIDDFAMTASLALTQEFSGHYRAALASWERAQRQVAVLGVRDMQAAFLMYSVSGGAMAGNCDHAATQVQAALKLDKNQETLAQAAFAASLCNAGKLARPILADLAKAYPSDTLVNQVTIPQSRAALALAAHQPGKALEQLEGSERFDLISPAAYLRGLAYLQLHDGQNAVAAFRAATRYRGAALLRSQNYPQAQLGLARAYAMTGDKNMAKTAYKDFFTTWKTADPGLPQLTSAKLEFASLQ